MGSEVFIFHEECTVDGGNGLYRAKYNALSAKGM